MRIATFKGPVQRAITAVPAVTELASPARASTANGAEDPETGGTPESDESG